jgi:hypothetical protein
MIIMSNRNHHDRRRGRGQRAFVSKPSAFLGALLVCWIAAFLVLPGENRRSATVAVSAFVGTTPAAPSPRRGRRDSSDDGSRSGAGTTAAKTSSALLAVRGQLPIPPPPPPSGNEGSLLDSPSRLLERLVEDVSSALDRIDLEGLRSKASGIVGAADWGSGGASAWIGGLEKQLEALDSRVLAQLSDAAASLSGSAPGVLGGEPFPSSAKPLADQLRTAVLEPVLAGALPQWIQLHPTLSLVASSLMSYVVVSSLLHWDEGPAPSAPYPNGRYDPLAARAYFDSRLPLAIARALEIFVRSASFGARVLKDYLE